MKAVVFAVLALLASCGVHAQDITEPRADASKALTESMAMITHASNSLEELDLFYKQGFGLEREGPFEIEPSAKNMQRKLWNIPNDLQWQEYRYSRPSTLGVPMVRALIFEQRVPAILQSWNSLQRGPMAIGFPTDVADDLDAHVRKLGFGAQGPLNRYMIPINKDKGYEIKETIFNGPDFVKGVVIYRGNGIPLAPLDAATKTGGPAYVSMVIDDSEAMLSFLTNVMDFEIRGDREATTTGALGAPAGTQYRFLIAYAKGARFGHLLMLQYRNQQSIAPAVTPTLPNRGIALLSFKTPNLDKVLKRAKAMKLKIRGPELVALPGFGQRRVAVIQAPNGMEFELVSGF
jgi:hypothetical protein